MVTTRQFGGVTLYEPGAYTKLEEIQAGNLPLAVTGIVGIIGEAAKGAPGVADGITEFSSDTLGDLITYYGSGPIVDAAKVLVNASNDERVLQGASRILVYKTNASTQAQLALATGWGTLKSQNYGAAENLINVTIEEDTAEEFSIEFGADWTTTPGSDLTLRVNGDILVTLTAANMDSAANAVTEINSKLNTALGTVAIAYASAATNRITIDLMATGTGAPRAGAGISLEFIASSEYVDIGVTTAQQGKAIVAGSGVISLVAANATRSFIVNRQSDAATEDSDSTTGEVGGQPYLEIGCNAATSCTATISSTQLVLTAVGAGASSLTLTLADYDTLNDLAEFIDSQTGYTCSVPGPINGSLPPTVLDRVSGVGICASTTGIKPGQLKADAWSVKHYFDLNSSLVTAIETSYLGLPDVLDKTFLAGGARGASTTSNFDAGFVAFESRRVNIGPIPLVSQDASDDKAEDESYTDSSSDYDVESIHLTAANHYRKMGSVQNRNERNGYLGYRGTFAEAKERARTINSELVSLAFQDVEVIGIDGNLAWKQPHIYACMVAGIQAGTEIGEPATFKYIAVNGLRHVKKQGITPSSVLELFDSDSQGERNQAIEAGLLIANAPSSGGFRITVHNTTYGKDQSFVFNRVSVIEAANYVAYDLRQTVEATYTGTKVLTGDAESIRNFIIARMEVYLRERIIIGDDTNGGLGWKNLTVRIEGNTVWIDITITPVQGKDFILATIRLDNIRQTA